jgi:hypothetical protein
MRRDDIRFSGKGATIQHHSARGKVTLRIPTIARMYSDLMPRSVPL